MYKQFNPIYPQFLITNRITMVFVQLKYCQILKPNDSFTTDIKDVLVGGYAIKVSDNICFLIFSNHWDENEPGYVVFIYNIKNMPSIYKGSMLWHLSEYLIYEENGKIEFIKENNEYVKWCDLEIFKNKISRDRLIEMLKYYGFIEGLDDNPPI